MTICNLRGYEVHDASREQKENLKQKTNSREKLYPNKKYIIITKTNRLAQRRY